MTSCCKRQAFIEAYTISTTERTKVTIPKATLEFALQVRTAVGVTIGLAPTVGDGYFSLAAGATYTEERLDLQADLVLYVQAASACTLEVWRWEG